MLVAQSKLTSQFEMGDRADSVRNGALEIVRVGCDRVFFTENLNFKFQ